MASGLPATAHGGAGLLAAVVCDHVVVDAVVAPLAPEVEHEGVVRDVALLPIDCQGPHYQRITNGMTISDVVHGCAFGDAPGRLGDAELNA